MMKATKKGGYSNMFLKRQYAAVSSSILSRRCKWELKVPQYVKKNWELRAEAMTYSKIHPNFFHYENKQINIPLKKFSY